MKWTFFPNPGGQENGFHDAGVETFKGNLERYLAREVIQNSLDARDDANKPVLVKFKLLKLAASDIPDAKSLATAFQRCADFWPNDKKAKKFFERAVELCRAKKITALKMGDYNTKGVTGSDTDRSDCWYSLLRCTGTSSKSGGEGGSFGIGKNAPFAASRLRTVLYSTMTKKKGVAFQAVAKLVTAKHPDGGLAQDTAYLGGAKGASIRAKPEIPDVFVRSKPGTDLIILGYSDDGDWKKDMVFSVLEYFWPAIHFADLEVHVEDTVINRKTLKDLLSQFSTEGEFTAHHYYGAFTDPDAKKFEDKLPTLGKVSVHLFAGDQDLPRKVAMVRRTGMVIYQQAFRSLVPYCGVFLCQNSQGNSILRDMEPPRHDEWDQNHPEKNAHRKTFSEFTQYIRDCIKKLAPGDSEKVLSIPELSKYLPDDEDSDDESFQGDNENESRKESFDRRPEEQKIKPRKLDRPRRQMQPDEAKPDDGDLETEEAGSSTGSGGGLGGTGANDTKGGKPGADGGGDGEGEARPSGGGTPGHNSKPAIPIRRRIFVKDLNEGIYTVIAEPLKPFHGNAILTLKAVGDDASTTTVAIESGKIVGGKELDKPKPGSLGPVMMNGRKCIRVEVKLVEPRKLAMEVEAHEAE